MDGVVYGGRVECMCFGGITPGLVVTGCIKVLCASETMCTIRASPDNHWFVHTIFGFIVFLQLVCRW